VPCGSMMSCGRPDQKMTDALAAWGGVAQQASAQCHLPSLTRLPAHEVNSKSSPHMRASSRSSGAAAPCPRIESHWMKALRWSGDMRTSWVGEEGRRGGGGQPSARLLNRVCETGIRFIGLSAHLLSRAWSAGRLCALNCPWDGWGGRISEPQPAAHLNSKAQLRDQRLPQLHVVQQRCFQRVLHPRCDCARQ